ncbi:hypothetical protein FBEOM_8952 [Fusarium beomiforme]|uniref:Uncharacterized protein n=1 Tax=Fusarium beomiforme TaxID=44412 RepID=A0A9P5DU01_9HYPO|nr:hypothetical protein FBEOM_8952 [Fusarium beomiforme]
MATLASLDVNITSTAVVSWRWNDTTRFLVEPDPAIRDITLTTRFDKNDTLFDLTIPIRLKGLKTGTTLIIRVLPSSISSFDFIENPTVPSVVRDKFISSTLLLEFRLNSLPKLLVSSEAEEPISPLRAQSGTVIDALRELANVTTVSVYIKNEATSKTHFRQIRQSISEGLFLVIQDDLASMYHGTGAKIITLPAPVQELPPSYDQTEPPPPAPPFYDRKRPRKDSREERDDDIAMIWAHLNMTSLRHSAEMNALKEENKDLKQEIHELKERLAKYEKGQLDLGEEFEAEAAKTAEKIVELGDLTDVKFLEVRDEGKFILRYAAR